jgi:transposase
MGGQSGGHGVTPTDLSLKPGELQRACYEDLPFRVLSGNQQPDHTRISEFRRRHLELLDDLFVQVLRLCQKSGLVQMGEVALDGTKVEANASIHQWQ